MSKRGNPFSKGPLAWGVRRQGGMVTRGQVRKAGFSRHQVDRLLASGYLLRTPFRGVFAVGHYPEAPGSAEMAAILALGDGAVLSHRSAGAFWSLCDRPQDRIEAIRPRCGATDLAGVKAYRIETLQPDEWLKSGALPVTTVSRTLLDLATVCSEGELAAAFAAADRAGKINPKAIGRVLGHGRRRGAQALRALFADYDPAQRPLRSEFERLVRARMEQRHDFEMPETNVIVNGREVDMLWRRKRLMVELDGYRHHSGDKRFTADRSRDLTMSALGYRVVRISWPMFHADPDGVLDRLAATLGDLPDARAKLAPD